LEKKRILIVDDDKSILKSFTQILQQEGYDVDTAETGHEAIEMYRTRQYALALLDIRLPDMEGTELLKIINGHTPRTHKIIITGYPSIDSALNALVLEADAYLTKPVDIQELLETVRKKLKEE